MSRPLINLSGQELKSEYEKATRTQDKVKLRSLAEELSHRRTPKARELLKEVEAILQGTAEDIQSEFTFNVGAAPKQQNKDSQSKIEHRKPTARSPKKPDYKPTSEQQNAITSFLSGGSLKINAYAGTGKTSTLELLAHSTQSKGQYLAFNKDIVRDAKEKFPDTVSCSTTHGLALKGIPKHFRTGKEKCFGAVNANQLCELMGIKKNWRIDKNFVLKPRSQGFLLLQTVKKFAQSAQSEPTSAHIPSHGSLLGAPPEVLKAVEAFALQGAKHIWERMCDPTDAMPLGHDGYLGFRALSDPQIAADYILLDEAQDTNPVVLEVLRRQSAQIIYVGDKYQQIYEWRGAINAMEEIKTVFDSRLTQSFRFGPEIASAASRVLGLLGETVPLHGNPKITSRVGGTIPQTILGRTNASTITALIEALDRNQKAHLVGEHADLISMLKGVEELRSGQPCEVPDFFGFNNWTEVVEFAKSGEGEHLLTFVNLVEAKGERQLMRALYKTSKEDEADIIISTAHKSKGREWGRVRLLDDFLKSKPKDRKPEDPSNF